MMTLRRWEDGGSLRSSAPNAFYCNGNDEDEDVLSCTSTILTLQTSNKWDPEPSKDTIRIYLGVAEAALNGNVQPLLNRVNRHLDGLDNNPATTYALITNILPAGNAYLFNNLPEFLQHAQRLQEALEREGRGEVFYTFWRVEQREAARRGLPGDVPARRASRAEGALRAADLPLEEAMPISATIVAAINKEARMVLPVVNKRQARP